MIGLLVRCMGVNMRRQHNDVNQPMVKPNISLTAEKKNQLWWSSNGKNHLRLWGCSIFTEPWIIKREKPKDETGWIRHLHFNLSKLCQMSSAHLFLHHWKPSSISTLMTHRAREQHIQKLVSLLQTICYFQQSAICQILFVNRLSTSPIR